MNNFTDLKTRLKKVLNTYLNMMKLILSLNLINPTPTGNKESKIAPKDMPNNGHHPNYGK